MGKTAITNKTKADLLNEISSLIALNSELRQNIDELRASLAHYISERDALQIEVAELTVQNNLLWKVIDKGLDVKEILDDAEDAVEDLKDLVDELSKIKEDR